MSKTHDDSVTVDALITYKNSQITTFASVKGLSKNKDLKFDNHGNYYVFNHNIEILKTDVPADAVAKYKSL